MGITNELLASLVQSVVVGLRWTVATVRRVAAYRLDGADSQAWGLPCREKSNARSDFPCSSSRALGVA